jgi:hypothetical protein
MPAGAGLLQVDPKRRATPVGTDSGTPEARRWATCPLFDITWRDGTRRTTYDGNWKAQQLSDAEYRTRFAADDAEYADMLQVLAAAARRPATDTVVPVAHDLRGGRLDSARVLRVLAVRSDAGEMLRPRGRGHRR